MTLLEAAKKALDSYLVDSPNQLLVLDAMMRLRVAIQEEERRLAEEMRSMVKDEIGLLVTENMKRQAVAFREQNSAYTIAFDRQRDESEKLRDARLRGFIDEQTRYMQAAYEQKFLEDCQENLRVSQLKFSIGSTEDAPKADLRVVATDADLLPCGIINDTYVITKAGLWSLGDEPLLKPPLGKRYEPDASANEISDEEYRRRAGFYVGPK
jgi:hypothetical protein